jgi:ABC-type multidrug transport system fused ATPase/permease subunit
MIFVFAAIGAVEYPTSLGQGSLGLVLVFCVLVLRSLEVGAEHFDGVQPDLAIVERLRTFCTSSVEEVEDRSEDKNDHSTDVKWLAEPWLREAPAVRIKSLHLGFADGPDIIQDLSLELRAGQKLGIHGGPGSGKTILLLSLLRLLHLRRGSVCLDDVDTSKLDLRSLRTSLGLVAQEPALLQGTIRFNLDPLSVHSNDEIISALNLVGLDWLALDSPREVASGHSSGSLGLSPGERRLLLLARMLLRQPALLLLDEVAGGSDVDANTKSRIQQIVLNSFPRSTVIAVARCSDSLVGFDRVEELRFGKLLE